MTGPRRSRTWAVTLGVALWLVGGLLGEGPAAQEDRPADRAALRALRDAGVKALNARDFAAVAGVVHPEFTIVTVDQQRFKGAGEFRGYWLGLFEGSRASLRSIALAPETESTRFLADDLALSHGTSSDTYVFTDGDTRAMKVRWSAVSQKVDGQWKLLSVHIGTSLFDNPYLQAVTAGARKTTIGVGIGALLVGALAGVLLGRRRAAPRG